MNPRPPQHPPNENKVLVPVPITAQPTFELAQQGRGILRKVNLPNGPVAQLGARFHGMEEVEGSNPSRSTTFFNHLRHLVVFSRSQNGPKTFQPLPPRNPVDDIFDPVSQLSLALNMQVDRQSQLLTQPRFD